MLRTLGLLVCCSVGAAGAGGALHKCIDQQGRVSFSDLGCAPGSAPQAYQPDALNLVQDSALKPAERRRLREIAAQERAQLKARARDARAVRQDGFERGLRVRELKMKRGDLEDQLRRRTLASERRAIQRRIARIDKQIAALEGDKP